MSNYGESLEIVTEGLQSALICKDGRVGKIIDDDYAFRISSCVNACAGMKNPEADISALKAQRDELALSLRKAALDFLNANGTIPSWWKDCVDIVKPILADKVEAIANAEKDEP